MSTDDEDWESRVAHVLRELEISAIPIRVDHGESNRVWIAGDAVLRMSARPGDHNLLDEAAIVQNLPPDAGYPAVLGSGIHHGHEWMAIARVDGINLDQLWPGLDETTKTAALQEVCARLDAVHRATLSTVDDNRRTPFYALSAALARKQWQRHRDLVGSAPADRLAAILREGFRALGSAGRTLVHTDAGLNNVLWDGRSATVIDFEFCCPGPPDLDVECLARSIRGEPEMLQRLAGMQRPLLTAPGAPQRLRAYAVLRDLWALGKWLQIAPEAEDIQTWDPLVDLRAHAAGTSWVHRLLD